MRTRVLAVVAALGAAVALIVIVINVGKSPPPAGAVVTDASPSFGASAVAESPSPSPSPIPRAACVQPNDPSSHVYNPDRLRVIQSCITASGTVDFERKEADGDYHVGLKLDPQYANLVNTCNATCLNAAEHGDLVVEPVCELPVTQADAVAACAGYHNPIVLPQVGAHVTVTGAYVVDVDHGWAEIHPLMTITPA